MSQNPIESKKISWLVVPITRSFFPCEHELQKTLTTTLGQYQQIIIVVHCVCFTGKGVGSPRHCKLLLHSHLGSKYIVLLFHLHFHFVTHIFLPSGDELSTKRNISAHSSALIKMKTRKIPKDPKAQIQNDKTQLRAANTIFEFKKRTQIWANFYQNIWNQHWHLTA